MTTNPYETAGSILDAAATGETVPGFESVGNLLIDLRTTTPVPRGVAISTSAVATASAATTPGTMAGVVALVKPTVVLLGLTVLAFSIGFSMRSSPEPGQVTITPATEVVDGVERVVSDGVPSLAAGEPELAAETLPGAEWGSDSDESAPRQFSSGPPAHTPGTSVAAPTTVAVTTTPAAQADPTSTTTDPTTTTPSTSSPSTTVPGTSTPPTTVPGTTSPPTTSEPELPEQQGNNGNGNGNGVGNGRGNNGNGGSGGNGGNHE